MKITQKERRAIEDLRQLDTNQIEGVLSYLRRQALANRTIAKIARVKSLRTVPDRSIERAFGTPLPRRRKP